MTYKKKVARSKFFILLPVLSITALMQGCALIFDGKETNTYLNDDSDISSFKSVKVDFTHRWNKETDFPYTGAAVIDIDNNGKNEIFVGGGSQQDDVLFSYNSEKNSFENIIAGTNLSSKDTTFSALSIDWDNDNDIDLFITRNTGVYLYSNNNGVFTSKKVDYNLPKDSIALNVAVSDINKDGLLDLYISHFVAPSAFVVATFNNPEHAKKNTMLLNKGNFRFEDVTIQTGTMGTQNTFHSSFVDFNNDGLADLVSANNTGRIDVFRNLGNLKFEAVDVNSGIGYWMGIAIGDIDNDGDQDLFLPNVGVTVAEKFLRGDLTDDQQLFTDSILLRNDGDFSFKNISAQSNVTGLGFGWGGTFEDINLDGRLDLLFAQNYVKWPKHKYFKLKNKSLIQATDGAFYQSKRLGLDNKHFGQSPLISDFNNDNKPDIFWVNMNDKQVAYLNQSNKNSVKVSFPDNAKYLGANVTAETNQGLSYTKQIIANTGMMTDGANELYFALADDIAINRLLISLNDGSNKVYQLSDEESLGNTHIIIED